MVPALPSDFSDSDNGNDSVATRLLNVPTGRWLPVDIIIEVELVHRPLPRTSASRQDCSGYVVRDFESKHSRTFIPARETPMRSSTN